VKFSFPKFTVCLSAAFLFASIFESGAFALLGPVQPWMQASNGVIFPGDIGGPMCIGNEYRWNVPVVTYGFDQSFLDYFGSNGVAAVESAIQVLNNLPPASQIVLTNYPFDSQQIYYAAQAQRLLDLKSETLTLLLEHLGLAQPMRYIYVLYYWDASYFINPSRNEGIDIFGMPISLELDPYGIDPGASGGTPGYITNFVEGFNFDPAIFEPSAYINNTGYAGWVSFNSSGEQSIAPFTVNQSASTDTAVADFGLLGGGFYTGLTYDDVGGLAYLLSTNNVNFETLLPGVCGIGTNANSFVNGAWRPGVDKITFIPQPVDSQTGAFLPTTNCFTDNYITNGILKQQQVARIISQPDFLFSAGDVTYGIPGAAICTRTGTTNWLNNATANGNTNGAGPGVIQPQVQIIFNKLGRLFSTVGSTSDTEAVDESEFLASFDGSTNAPVIYPIPQPGTNQLTVRMWLILQNFQESFEWQPDSLSGAQFAMETSTNLIDWTALFTVTNNGSVCTYLNEIPVSTSRFYRLIQQ
jgi:hypothetical protein